MMRALCLAALASVSSAATPPRWIPPFGTAAGDFLGGAAAPTPGAALDPLYSLCQGTKCPSLPTTQTWVSNLGLTVFMSACNRLLARARVRAWRVCALAATTHKRARAPPSPPLPRAQAARR